MVKNQLITVTITKPWKGYLKGMYHVVLHLESDAQVSLDSCAWDINAERIGTKIKMVLAPEDLMKIEKEIKKQLFISGVEDEKDS